MAARSKMWVCSHSFAGIAGSNSTGRHGCLSVVGGVCCQVETLRRADHSSGGIVPSVVSLSVIVNPQQRGGLGPLGMIGHGERENYNSLVSDTQKITAEKTQDA
jgi:hypothetical protein